LEEIQERCETMRMSFDNLFISSAIEEKHYEKYPQLLLDENYRNYIKELCLNNNIKILMMDNKTSLCPGLDENSSKE